MNVDLSTVLLRHQIKISVAINSSRRRLLSFGNTSSSRSHEFSHADVHLFRSSLKVAEVELASARSHVQQFKEISQASESALANLNATYDEYKSATEAQLTMREVNLR